MARILTVGIATLDIINAVDGFPPEDAEVRATAQEMRRGGNASNTAVVLSQLGHECAFAGSLADDASSEVIRAELKAYRIDMGAVATVAGGRVPVSYVTLNQQNGSRTIVHYRELPEYRFADFARIDLHNFDWLHFEGRNVPETRVMLDHARQQRPTLPISVEFEKPRPEIESLCAGADLLLYSRGYVQKSRVQQGRTQQGAEALTDPVAFLREQHRRWPGSEHTCTWGADGAWGIDRHGGITHSPAPQLSSVVDTLGAGDTFNAGMIHGRLSGGGLSQALAEACQLAAEKCARQGLHGLRLGGSSQ
ncbi:MAG: PfkB family carbohydrate kinase [Gammaproteobacteria bacterium]|nr:PfkB family carbohydrate kinase [Gammaproteobacteria bacterium]